MTVGAEKLSVPQNCAAQGLTASFSFLLWQLVYTAPRFDEKIWEPMQEANTSLLEGLGILGLFAMVSFIHSITFYHALRYLPGGSTSAGVFKGLQAVLVFLFTDWAYCGRIGGMKCVFRGPSFCLWSRLREVLFGMVSRRRNVRRAALEEKQMVTKE